jgi:tetratricopeptide (TPR) repeat protein
MLTLTIAIALASACLPPCVLAQEAGLRQSSLALPLTTAAERGRVAAKRGETLFAAGNYDAALSEFTEAYRWLDGEPLRYQLLNNIAVCHERSFRYDQALAYYTRYLDESGPDARDRSEVERIVRTLRALLARIAVASNVRAEVWIDQRRVGSAPGHFAVPAGRHAIELRAPRYESSRRELQLSAGSQAQLRFELARLSQFQGISPAYFWTSLALTAATLGVGIGTGLSALAAHRAAERRAAQDPFLNTLADQRALQRTTLIADLAFGGAALFGASSIVLYLLTDWRAPVERNLTLGFRAGLDGGQAQLHGPF